MGQYYKIVNLDKKEYLTPWTFGDGAKLLEFGCSGCSMMTGLAILLADGNGRGGGDLHSDNEIIGSWAGDRIVVAGDYADAGKWLDGIAESELLEVAKLSLADGYQKVENVDLYAYASERFKDISYPVMQAMMDDAYVREDLLNSIGSKPKAEWPDWLKDYHAEHKTKTVTHATQAL